MTQRIFVTVGRGMTDKTAVCIFPWEKRLLERIHGDQVQEVSIEQMCDLGDALKVEKIKFARKQTDDDQKTEVAPGLRAQLEAMATVDEDADPAQDPAGEFNRLAEKYGMDKEIAMPVVAVMYGQFESGAFEAAIKQSAGGASRRAQPKELGEYAGKSIADMSINELRSALRKEGVTFDPSATKAELSDLLATAQA